MTWDPIQAITVIVKAFERPTCLERLISSIRKFYPSIRILVADDGRKPYDPGYGTELLSLPFDVGASAARNLMLDRVATPYVLKLDDDFVFTRHTDLYAAWAKLRKLRADVLGGATVWMREGQWFLRHYAGLIQRCNSVLKIYPACYNEQEECIRCDITPDFFLGRTKALAEVRWDPEIKITGIHPDFFLRLKEAKKRVFYWPAFRVVHWPERSFRYSRFRRRPEYWRLMLTKHNLTAIEHTLGNWVPLRSSDVGLTEGQVMSTNEPREDILATVPQDRWWQRWGDATNRKRILSYWQQAPDQRLRRQQLYTCIEKICAAKGFKSILDCGCGAGEDYLFYKALGLDYLGLDVTPAMIQEARRRYPELNAKVADIFALPFDAETQSFVVCNAVLPHLPKALLPKAIAELWRVTRQTLVIRLFGVDAAKNDRSVVQRHGFLVNQLRAETWLKLCQQARLTVPVITRSDARNLKDVMILSFTREA